MPFVGADPEQLERAAGRFETNASTISEAARDLARATRTCPWSGADADDFVALMTNTVIPRMQSMSERMTLVAGVLRREAEQQRATSTGLAPSLPAGGGITGGLAGVIAGAAAEVARQAAMAEWYRTVGRAQLDAITSPAEAAAWWASLTPEQREAMMLLAPGRLAGLDGLPPDVRAAARQAYLDQRADDVPVSSRSDNYAASVDIGVVKIGVEGEAKFTTFHNGEVEVTLSLDGSIGRKIGADNAGAEIGIDGGVTATYRFSSMEEAQAFVDGLVDVAVPTVGEAAGRSAFGWVPGVDGVAEDALKDSIAYLEAHESNQTDLSARVGVYGKGSIDFGDGLELELEGRIGASHSFTTDDTTISITGSGNLAADIGLVQGAGSGEVGLELVVDSDGNVTSLKVTGSMEVSSGADLGGLFDGRADMGQGVLTPAPDATSSNPVLKVESTSGYQGTFEATIDLTDPATRAAAMAAAQAMMAGEPSTALAGLIKESEMTVQLNTVQNSEQSFDAAVVSGSHSSTTAESQLTLVKPAGGPFMEMERT